LISWIRHTDHDLILEDEHDKISYIIKIMNYTQKMMKKFLNMRLRTKTANSVDLRQCKKISRDLDKLNQDQIIQITNEMKFYLKQSSINQRDVIDEFCRRVKYGYFRSGQYGYFDSDRYEHFDSDKDGFYMSDKWIFRAWCDSAFFKAEKVCQAINNRLIEID
jgi:predicted amino acid-binding ACT domain protein